MPRSVVQVPRGRHPSTVTPVTLYELHREGRYFVSERQQEGKGIDRLETNYSRFSHQHHQRRVNLVHRVLARITEHAIVRTKVRLSANGIAVTGECSENHGRRRGEHLKECATTE